MNIIEPCYSLDTKALLDLNSAVVELGKTFPNPESYPREIMATIQVGVTHPKFVYALNEYSAEVSASHLGNLTLTLFHQYRMVIEYHSDVVEQQELTKGAFADAIMHWLINNVK